jgi:hypothetical protein
MPNTEPTSRPINAGFVLLDIKRFRHKIERRLTKGERIVVRAYIEIDPDPRSWNDDGESIEFTGQCLNCYEVDPKEADA